jgi:uncharacterized protein YidB (DUF937 family)
LTLIETLFKENYVNSDAALKIAAQAFQAQLGTQGASLPLNAIVSALGGLLMTKGKLDVAGLVSRLQTGGLASLAASWLGDGGNLPVDAKQISGLFDQGQLSAFAEQLGLEQGQAVKGLQGAIPNLIDKASSGGALSPTVVSAGAAALGKLFGR